MSEMLAGDVAFLLYQLSVDDYLDDDTFDAVINDDFGRCEINIQDLAESAARHIESLEAQISALKEENERLKADRLQDEEKYCDLLGRHDDLFARVAELEAKDHEIFLVASSVAEDVGKGKYQIGYSAACADIVGRFYSKEPANEG